MEMVEDFKQGEILGRLTGQRMAIDAILVVLIKNPAVTVDELAAWLKDYDNSVKGDIYAIDAALDNITSEQFINV